MNLNKTTAGYVIAAIIAIAANTALVFAKELYEPLKAGMKASLGHHWITHAAIIVALFLVLGFILSKWPLGRINGTFLAIVLFLVTAAASVGIIGFFLFE
ncbi:hypothetical protein A2763_03440 [Candidatus Kaiserbacteria bacterium RIFCSPHIGHO2_01_FULL_54_36]|uniref:Uncharacterized protein n=1 Tax=Candidatus Kaiserbacteria bacterium RIFCSPHIGHO2_01_FULL_54_36 TaxID=1798482 RepID=A0A1F6CMA5_9BACT|nr:MAG: hypothetical protein A2763_03440 [Candidatus Kaiserbacteria bacterium RIFCSPHIGHO2_01_FULL_54_36]OGG75695.1 MAG: hypothetical protein A3A41_02640 [Candidatus Kaiserbacteria bacterium RIFCSPLOWO2_01_FULL_54_22]